jgi:hypothetical protein
MAKSSKFWAGACAGLSVLPAAAAGAVKGTYDAATGNGKFSDSFNKTTERIIDAAEEFGSENGGNLTAAAIAVAARVGGGALDQGVNHPRHPS